jgi:hypothetical protein
VQGSKLHSIAEMISSSSRYSLQALKKEIAKCEVRCSNCHQEKTWLRQNGLESTLQEAKQLSNMVCICGTRKSPLALLCLTCTKEEKAKLADKKYGNIDNLVVRLQKEGFEAVARTYNVSSNAIRKYLKVRSIDTKTRSVLD